MDRAVSGQRANLELPERPRALALFLRRDRLGWCPPVAQGYPEHIVAPGAECHADSDLIRTLDNEVRNHSV